MTANSPSSVAESARSTTDPDAQARRANDGERSAGCHSGLTIDEEAVDGLVTAEEFAAEFDENRDDDTLYAEYRRLAAEQDALRRLATLVARGVAPLEDLARWPTRCADACLRPPPDCGASRRTASSPSWPPRPIPRRWHDGRWAPELRCKATPSAALVQRSGRPARIDNYDTVAGPIAARVRAVGVRAAVGVPIIVDGRVWGLAGVGSRRQARCRPTPRSASAASPS